MGENYVVEAAAIRLFDNEEYAEAWLFEERNRLRKTLRQEFEAVMRLMDRDQLAINKGCEDLESAIKIAQEAESTAFRLHKLIEKRLVQLRKD